MTVTEKLQVRLISPWQTYAETDTAVFSSTIPVEKADALLCEWAPHPELFTFPRRKAWYCCESACRFHQLEQGTWPKLKQRLGPHEFLYHGHSNPQFRVPHITHFEPLQPTARGNRLDRAIAIVSNFGGPPWKRHPDIAYRNRLITDPLVDLYGRSGWKRYRAHWYSRAGAPANYRGEIPGDWPAGKKRELLSQYKVAVCLENMNEPHYFTEKFVEAVVAGCVPVYRAHPTIRYSVLEGASWIDVETIQHDQSFFSSGSLAELSLAIPEQNALWLAKNELLQQTSAAQVFQRIAKLLSDD